ncbi:PREDICTED: long-chain-fatty-acid--CoA ligase 5 [Nanorana parkeri]|uniref:long-chain-fatty-acid--CoA ligase 5 n=1 Tax=Nanorana parkeri TaxID=125878 RepID=UPI000854BAA7|nr:PREDICTED: long-chain-fatty-acid--CoA ligase 5 [Nanorana parkeri]
MCCCLGFLFTPLPTSLIVVLITIGISAFIYVLTKPKPVQPPIDLNRQSIGTEGGARRCALLKDDTLMTHYYEDAKTLYEVFMRGLRVSGDGDCLGSRRPNQPYTWITYKQVADRAEVFGSGLLQKGCKASPEQFIGVFSQNRPEVVIAELACYSYSMVVVPLYDTLGPEALVFIVNRGELSVVVCDKPDKVQILLDNCEKGLTPVLKTIILMEAFGDDLKERGAKYGVEVLLMKDVEYLGKENFKKLVPPKPDDLCLICFTSGTTGDPKGAMLTHKNVVADAASFIKNVESTFAPMTSDVLISYLPMAHMFERVVQTVVFCSGAKVGFFQGDIRILTDDMKVLRPTVFPTVPRLLNRIYDKIQSGAKTPFKKRLLKFAVACKFAEVKKGIIRRDSIWDQLIFKKVQETMGGRVRIMVTGAAPISDSVLSFLRASLGCQIFEAYGQTECGAGCSFSTPGDWTAGHVGAPLPCNLLKLVDVAEMNYFYSNGEGEVCIKGPNVFQGYLKDPEKTAEAMDEDGWLHTGDIGKWLPNGTLKIIDRKKNIFKLAQGEYIAPEKIENIYVRSGPVAQVFVHGDSLRSCLVGVVIPDPEVLPDFAAKLGARGSYEDLCKNPAVKKAILEDLVKIGKQGALKSFEQVKDIYVHEEMLSIENGLLTPTLKAKRAEVAKYFRRQIDELYSKIQE